MNQLSPRPGQSALMVETLFARLGEAGIHLGRDRYAVNIGCLDGKDYNDPVYPLYRAGFVGLAIDGLSHPELERNLGGFGVTLRPGVFVYPENVAEVLREGGCPIRPTFLKMDIDGADADVLKAILEAGYRPLVIQAELNSEFPPPIAFSVSSSSAFGPGSNEGFFGFSLQYGVDLLGPYGYALIELDFVTEFTHDALWVERTLLEAAGLSELDARAAFLAEPSCLPHIATVSPPDKEAWRSREDYSRLREEIWVAMLEAGRRKFGHANCPFELYIASCRRTGAAP